MMQIELNDLMKSDREHLYISLWCHFAGDSARCKEWLLKMGATTEQVKEFTIWSRDAKDWYRQALKTLLTRDVVRILNQIMQSGTDPNKLRAIDLVLKYYGKESEGDDITTFLRELQGRAK